MSVKHSVARVVLRGPVLRAWYERKIHRIERVYLKETVRQSSIEKTEPKTVRLRTGEPLRRILFIGDIMWEQNFLVPELRRLAETLSLDLRPYVRDLLPGPALTTAVVSALRAFIGEQNGWEPDVILLYARSPLLSDELFAALRSRWKCPVVGMQLDDKVNFLAHGIIPSESNDNYAHWAKRFDLNLTNCLVVSDWYRACGLPIVYFPQGFLNEDLSPPAVSPAYRHELSFLGSIKPDREVIVNRLLAEGVPIDLFGKGWPNAQWVENPTEIYRSSQINLGIGFATPNLTTIKGRDFECPGVGACYLTTYNWELANWFDLGKEILLYRCVEELLEMLSYYRRRPEECARIALAAWHRCKAEHTWEKRFRKLFRQLGFGIAE